MLEFDWSSDVWYLNLIGRVFTVWKSLDYCRYLCFSIKASVFVQKDRKGLDEVEKKVSNAIVRANWQINKRKKTPLQVFFCLLSERAV
jgi:hypothetical protein